MADERSVTFALSGDAQMFAIACCSYSRSRCARPAVCLRVCWIVRERLLSESCAPNNKHGRNDRVQATAGREDRTYPFLRYIMLILGLDFLPRKIAQ